MSRRTRQTWLPRLLWWFTFGLSTALIALVLCAPLLDNGAEPVDGWGRLLRLFAHDATLRRTAVASAVGLVVTACVFFRQPAPVPRTPRPERERAPSNVVGA